MVFSELKNISAETGLEWDESRLALIGTLYDYPVVLKDIPEKREYLLTVFCRMRPSVDESVTKGITLLLDKLPQNAVAGRKNELHYQQLRFNAQFLYQENLPLLADFVKGLVSLLNGYQLVPCEMDEKTAFPIEKIQPKKREKRPADSVSKRFDKYSVRGFIGAFLGAAAMSVISGLIIKANDGSNVGVMLASWSAGALIALVTLADYRFLARKIDVFGTLSCSALTAAACFICSWIGTVRAMINTASAIFPDVPFFSAVRNRTLYLVLFGEITDDFILMLVKSLFSALIASAAFYTVYYRRHSAIMYSEGGDYVAKS